jgi:hypothetical protein
MAQFIIGYFIVFFILPILLRILSNLILKLIKVLHQYRLHSKLPIIPVFEFGALFGHKFVLNFLFC